MRLRCQLCRSEVRGGKAEKIYERYGCSELCEGGKGMTAAS